MEKFAEVSQESPENEEKIGRDAPPTPRSLEHPGLGVRAQVKELTQGDLERFGAAIVGEMARNPENSTSQRRGNALRAAIAAGWFEELAPVIAVSQVNDQAPAVVALLGEWIDRLYIEVTTIPPK